MVRPLILARDFRTATEVGRLLKTREWRYLQPNGLRGTRNALVLAVDGWSEGKTNSDWFALTRDVTFQEPRLVTIDSPYDYNSGRAYVVHILRRAQAQEVGLTQQELVWLDLAGRTQL